MTVRQTVDALPKADFEQAGPLESFPWILLKITDVPQR